MEGRGREEVRKLGDGQEAAAAAAAMEEESEISASLSLFPSLIHPLLSPYIARSNGPIRA